MCSNIDAVSLSLITLVNQLETSEKTIPSTFSKEQLDLIESTINKLDWQKGNKAQLIALRMTQQNPNVGKIIRLACQQLPENNNLKTLNSPLSSCPLLLDIYTATAKDAEKNIQTQLSPFQKYRMKVLQDYQHLPSEIRSVIEEFSTQTITSRRAIKLINDLILLRGVKPDLDIIDRGIQSIFPNQFSSMPPLSNNQQDLISLIIVHLLNHYEIDFQSLLCKNFDSGDINSIADALKLIESFGPFGVELKRFVFSVPAENFTFFDTISPEEMDTLKILCPFITELQLKNLIIIDLHFKTICGFTHLESLKLNKNKIDNIPDEIKKLSRLKNLDLGENCINKISPYLGQLTELTTVHLGKNNLMSLPETLVHLTKLYSLNLSFNKFKEIPQHLPNSLRVLNLANNQIVGSKNDFKYALNLEELNLSNNKLNTLSGNIATLTNLRVLNLHNNNLKVLPNELARLHNIECLVISDNSMRVIPQNIYSIRGIIIKTERPRLKIERQSLINCLDLLYAIAHRVSPDYTKMLVKFSGEPARDEGGPSRELFSTVFAHFSDLCVSDGNLLWRLCSQQQIVIEKLCKYLGKTLAYSHRIGTLPIGNIFNSGTYYALIHCEDSALNKPYNDLTIHELISFMDEDYQEDLKIAALLQFENGDSYEQYPPEILKIVKDLFISVDLQNIPTSLTEQKMAVKKALLEICEDRIRPLQLVAKAFKNNTLIWSYRKDVGSKLLEETIQGVNDEQKILASLNFENISEQHKNCLLTWLKENERNRQLFIKCVTGASTLSVGTKIAIKEGPSFFASTCGNYLEIPSIFTEEMLLKELNDLMTGYNAR